MGQTKFEAFLVLHSSNKLQVIEIKSKVKSYVRDNGVHVHSESFCYIQNTKFLIFCMGAYTDSASFH